MAVPIRPARSVLVKSNVVVFEPSIFFTDQATSAAWAKNAIAKTKSAA